MLIFVIIRNNIPKAPKTTQTFKKQSPNGVPPRRFRLPQALPGTTLLALVLLVQKVFAPGGGPQVQQKAPTGERVHQRFWC